MPDLHPQSPRGRVSEFDPVYIRNISEAVYRYRMGEKDADEFLAEHGAEKFRRHAGSYDALTRAYLRVFESHRNGEA